MSPVVPPHKRLQYLLLFNATATTKIYTLSLHDALPILTKPEAGRKSILEVTTLWGASIRYRRTRTHRSAFSSAPKRGDRKSTRLNSSHEWISYAVFCLKKKKKQNNNH